MCGLAGSVGLPTQKVFDMLETMVSRGPDNTGLKQIGPVVLGHTRLSIVDKSAAGNQPMSFAALHMVYNGELYQDFGHEGNDSKQLLREFASKGLSCLNSLQGMFAFAIYEETQNEIILVRDRFGIKPLYYTLQPDYFAFASTPGALTHTKDNWKLSREGLSEFLSLGATQEHSMFEGIKAFMPGHYAIYNIESRSLEIKRWYNPKPVPNAYENIEERVIKAIDRVKLTCDWPQTVLLSGGIDSTLVASRYVGNGAIHLRSPEQNYAEQVAEKFDLNLKIADPEEVSAEECLTDYVQKCGDPTMAGLIPYIACKEIAKQGYRVAITANGADELFYGYDRMKGDRMDQIAHIFRPLGADFYGISQNSAQKIELDYYLTHDLNKTLDFSSMCHSVEVRVPYLDHELVEAAMSIPIDSHLERFGNKSILKKMLNKLGFDWDFIHRPKVGFSLHYWPKDWGPLQQKAMVWYIESKFPQLPANATPRQQSYHEVTVTGLYVFLKVFHLEY